LSTPLWLYDYYGIEQSQHVECVLESQYIRLLVFAFLGVVYWYSIRVLFIGTQFSNLYTAVDTPA
jgi:hypothetical protein